MTVAIYAGSFDPITYGHLDIINSGIKIFDEVVVLVTYNPKKTGFIPIDDRIELIKECTNDKVKVCTFNGLTVDFAKQYENPVLLRGIRNAADYEYEKELAYINSNLNSEIPTVCLFSRPEHCFISSSAAREILNNNGPLNNFLPDNVIKYLNEH